MTTLDGKRMLITGAASGIGRATALRAARRGAKLVLADLDASGLVEAASAVRREGGEVLAAHAFDVAHFEAVRDFAARIHREHGSLDVVMNNAGIAVWGPIERLSHDDWRRVLEVNLMGTVHVLESFVPKMIEAGRGGHVVNVSSAAGLFGLPWHAAYSASKFGVRGLSEVLRFDLERHGIRVSLVCPGGVRTGLVHTVKIVGADPESAAFQRMKRRFEARAVSPSRAAERILRGVERDRYHVYTSSDVAIGHWIQRKLAWPYELLMRRLNREFERAASRPGATRGER